MLRTQIKEHLLKERERRIKKKDSFWCTENELNQFDIYQRFKGIEPTNPMTPETAFGLGMRKKLEEAVVEILDNMGILIKPKDGQHRVEMERFGVKITGYMDAVIKEENKQVPVEIKTSFGYYQQKELMSGKPKLNYLKQLAQYMDSMNANKGYLFQVHFEKDLIVDDIYQFVVTRNGSKFKCGYIKFDINDTYKRYKEIYEKYILPDIEPPSEFIYKYPLEKIDWKSLPNNKISKARNNRAIIGDWQCIYSDYKDLIIKREGTVNGYTDKEIDYIMEKTKGYTNW